MAADGLLLCDNETASSPALQLTTGYFCQSFIWQRASLHAMKSAASSDVYLLDE
jgi:hypothetical protein